MPQRSLRLFFVSQSLAFSYFWIAISIPYLLYRGLSTAETFSLMAIYQLVGVALEYPTGVIGDKFGYRKVTYLANTLNFLAMTVMAQAGGYNWYLFAMMLQALGSGFSSGNDMGILKSVSVHIKKDTANYNALADFVLFISAIVGGLLSKISFELALWTSGLLMFSANIPLYLIKDGIKHVKNDSTMLKTVLDGFGSLRSPSFRQLFLIVATFGGLSFVIKSIFGSFGSIYGIDVATVGWLVGLGGLARSLGSKLYAEYPRLNITILGLILASLVLLTGLTHSLLVTALLMLINQPIFGYMLSKIDGEIHDLASDHVRASIFSLKRLLMRLVAAGYLALYGYAIGVGQFPMMMYGTAIVLATAVLFAWKFLNVKNPDALLTKELAAS